MWFKNITLFEFIEGVSFDVDSLSDKLNDYKFIACKSSDPSSMGWVSPVPGFQETDSLVHGANGFFMIALKSQEKIVPASIIKEMLDEKVEELEIKENRKVRKKEKDALKEDIYQMLLPRAFLRTNITYAYIDVSKRMLVINSASAKKSEQLTIELRKALGSLKIKMPDLLPIPLLLTKWIKENIYPKDLVVEDNCVLQDNNETGGVIRCQGQDLLSEDIVSLIDGGRDVIQLGLSWSDQVRFVVNDDFVIKSIKFLEVIQDQANDSFADTPAQQFDADFVIMTNTLRELLVYLSSILFKERVDNRSKIEGECLVLNAEKYEQVDVSG
jgi:recombination associated protein RdgC